MKEHVVDRLRELHTSDNFVRRRHSSEIDRPRKCQAQERQQAIDAKLATEISRCAREMPGYCQMWKRLFPACDCCEDGYYVKSDRTYTSWMAHFAGSKSWFGGCSCFKDYGCEKQLTQAEYKARKHYAILALLTDREPPKPCVVKPPGRMASRFNRPARRGPV